MSNQSPTGYDGNWLPADEDPRYDGKPEGELATYRDYLRNYRLTLELKCAGLTPEQLATRSVPPSSLSLLGLVRHAAQVEHSWFQRALQANLEESRPFADAPDAAFDGAIGTEACVTEGFAAWHREVGRAEAWLDTQTEADMARVVVYNSDGETASVRDILVHLVEEYARHCGHADLLRECLDGRTGQ